MDQSQARRFIALTVLNYLLSDLPLATAAYADTSPSAPVAADSVAAAGSQGTAGEQSPLMMEISTAIDAAKRQADALAIRINQETDSTATLDLVRQLETVKINTELDIMRIQMRYAQKRGDFVTVDKIAAALATMTRSPSTSRTR